MLQYRFRDFASAGHFCHVAETVLQPKPFTLHTHDFHEVFWVRDGAGKHVINGGEVELRPGMLVLVHAGDCHALCPADGQMLEIVNIAFARQTWKALHERYGPAEVDPFEQGVQERHRDLTGVRYSALQNAAEELLGSSAARLRWSRFAVERFLMNLWYLLQPTAGEFEGKGAPDWLTFACREVAQPRHLRQGTAAFVELAGRSPEHVARATRKWFGKTPTELINQTRMNYAARRLAQSNDGITEIADECGLTNLSHFYELFRNEYAVTPRAYRLQQQAILRPVAVKGA